MWKHTLKHVWPEVPLHDVPVVLHVAVGVVQLHVLVGLAPGPVLGVDAVPQLEGGEDGEYLAEEGDAEEHRHQGDQTSAIIHNN